MPNHVNRAPFSGVLTFIDMVSDKAPSGARGHLAILTRDAAVDALPSLIGMAVDCCPDWDGHDTRRKVGIITSARIVGAEVHVRGFIYAKDFKDILHSLKSKKLGMSWEIHGALIENMGVPIWRITKATFTGAAILLAEKAAFKKTRFVLHNSKPKRGVVPTLESQ